MKRKYLKLSALILSVSALTVLSSCETSARYIGSNTWEGTVTQTYHDPNEWYGLSQSDVEGENFWNIMNGLYNNYKKIYLKEDITLTATNYAIWIQNPGITLCLHGHNINAYSGAGTNETEGVISIKDGSGDGGTTTHGSLTLEDCVGGGKITGGNDVYNESWQSGGSGGGISVNGSECSLTMNGGIIEGNSAEYLGGGIYNYAGYVEINGGTIKNNTAGQNGGGIYNDGGTLTINGGTISGNTALDGGGVYSSSQYTSISGGTITGNSATYDAGGVKFESYDADGNNTSSYLTLSGSPTIKDNYSGTDKVEYNVELSEYSLITLNGISSDAYIGITYDGLYGKTYQISTNYEANGLNSLYLDQNSDYSEYYTIGAGGSNNYLELVYKDGLGDYNNQVSVTLQFTFKYQDEVDTSFPTDYGELYIKGDWNNYEKQDLVYDATTYQFSITLSMSVDIHYYELHLSYLNNDDDYPLYDYTNNGQLSFKIPADTKTSLTIPVELAMEQSFIDTLPDEGNIEKTTTKIVFRWWYSSSALTPQTLEYGDMYIYSSLNDWADWYKCEVEEIDGTYYYCLDLYNVEAKEYEYTAVLYYSNETIPAPTDTSLTSDWWSSHRVDYNENPGDNSKFTPSAEYIADGIIYVDHDAKQSSLSYILLESGYILDNSITLSLDLTYNSESVSPNSSGSYYFSYGWSGQEGWSTPEALTYNSSTGKYEITLSNLYATTYQYDVMFVYTSQSYDAWTHKLTSTDRDMTFHWNDSGIHEETVSFDVDPSPFGHALVMGDTNTLTVYFSITQYNVVYDVGLGYNLYICGAWDNWASFYLCTYDYSYVAGNQVFYRAVLPITVAANYEFKILKFADTVEPSWSSTYEEIVDTDNSGNACMYVDATAISQGYSLQYFYVSGGSGNWQKQE